MPFEHSRTTTVETKDLRQLLQAIDQAQLEQAKKMTEHMLGLDRKVNHAED